MLKPVSAKGRLDLVNGKVSGSKRNRLQDREDVAMECEEINNDNSQECCEG